MNIIQLNTLHLNVVLLNGDEMPGEVVVGGGEVVPVPPTEPETPDVPVEPKKFILSASVANGVVSATLNGVVVSLPYTANEGDTIVLSVTPNDGYEFNGWNDGNTDNPRTITMNADVALSAQCVEVVQPPVGNYIQFEDAEVERILMSKGVSSDGVGITIEDAEKVTSISTWFKGNTAITSFEEFAYFKNCTSLVASAFEGCTSLTKLNVEHIEVMNNRALYGCTALNYDYLNLANLVTLGGNALNGVKARRLNLSKLPVLPTANTSQRNYGDSNILEEVILADNLEVVPEYSFLNYTNLRDCNINAVKQIGKYAFASCSSYAKDLNVPNLQTIGEGAFRSSGLWKISNLGVVTRLPDGVNASNGVFGQCADLQEVNLPRTCEYIGSRAFSTCGKLSKITMGDVANMGEAVFAYTNFEEFVFPNSVATIGKSCLFSCPSLKKVVIGTDVSSIGMQLASGSAKLATIVCLAMTPPSINTETFTGTNLCPIYVPNASVEAYKGATNWSSYASRIKGLSEYNG